MTLMNFNRKKNVGNIFFVSLLVPYILLCLTMGGFHGGVFSSNHCNHELKNGSYGNHDNNGCQLIGTRDDITQHDSETCQICQWLKTPSASVPFLTVDAHFDFVCVSSPRDFNTILPSLSIHKYTIRPPPASSSISA